MRLLVTSAIGVGLPLSAAACFYGLDEPGSRPWNERAPEVGSIGFKLTMPANVMGDALDYKISGPGAYQKVGNIPFSVNSRTFSALISDIPFGSGYQLHLTFGSQGSETYCTGATTFDLGTRATAGVDIKVQCFVAKKGGDHGGKDNLCPVIDDIYIWPETDGTYELSTSACDLDSGPAPLTYKWSAAAGTLSATDDEVVFFTCPDNACVAKVTLEVSDSDCSATRTEEVHCDGASTTSPGGHKSKW